MNIWVKRLFIVLSIGGGYCGIILMLMMLPQAGGRIVNYALLGAMMAVFAFGIFCGLRFIENEKNGLRWLRRFFAIQIPILSSPIITYYLSVGAGVNVSFIGLKLNMFFRFGSEMGLFVHQDRPWGLGVNVIALVLYIWTSRLLKKMEFSQEAPVVSPVP